MLAAYRELKDGQTDTTALEVHLADCTQCRQLFAQCNLIGERVRSLSPLEPLPEARAHLMQALAAEHVRFINTLPASAIPPSAPAFLIPYLAHQARKSPQSASLTA